MQDPLLGHRLRPGAVAIDHALEFTARYAINEQGLRDTALYEALHTEDACAFSCWATPSPSG